MTDSETSKHEVPRPGWPRRFLQIAGGVAVVAVAARVNATIPGSSVPQSAQTLAVLVVGALLGARDGTLCLAAYLLAGAVGIPVFADGASGWAHLVGPTSGYLVGFVAAAGLCGRFSDVGLLRRVAPAVGLMLCAHVLILALGWARLSWAIGPSQAWGQGVGPFVGGGFVKSLAAALVVVAVGGLKASIAPRSST